MAAKSGIFLRPSIEPVESVWISNDLALEVSWSVRCRDTATSFPPGCYGFFRRPVATPCTASNSISTTTTTSTINFQLEEFNNCSCQLTAKVDIQHHTLRPTIILVRAHFLHSSTYSELYSIGDPSVVEKKFHSQMSISMGDNRYQLPWFCTR